MIHPVPHLGLVTQDDYPARRHSHVVGLVDTGTLSDREFSLTIEILSPGFVFDLRLVPYFDFGGRRRIFDLFRRTHTTYRDLGDVGKKHLVGSPAQLQQAINYIVDTISIASDRNMLVLSDSEQTAQTLSGSFRMAIETPFANFLPMILGFQYVEGAPRLFGTSADGRRALITGEPSHPVLPQQLPEISSYNIRHNAGCVRIDFELRGNSFIEISFPETAIISMDRHLERALAEVAAFQEDYSPEPLSIYDAPMSAEFVRMLPSKRHTGVIFSFEDAQGVQRHAVMAREDADALRGKLQDLCGH